MEDGNKQKALKSMETLGNQIGLSAENMAKEILDTMGGT